LTRSGEPTRRGGANRGSHPTSGHAARARHLWIANLIGVAAGGKHTQDLGLECVFCHPYARTSAHSGLPDAAICSLCHSTTQGTSSEAARVTELLAAGDSLHFNKLFGLPAHVFYTHRRHVTIAGLECTDCHGTIAETDRPPSRSLVQVDMDFCIACHRRAGASLNCNACHR
jgi:hypothetical protein